jgi:hypothetical protein
MLLLNSQTATPKREVSKWTADTRSLWLTSVILVTKKAKIRKIMVQSQPGK